MTRSSLVAHALLALTLGLSACKKESEAPGEPHEESPGSATSVEAEASKPDEGSSEAQEKSKAAIEELPGAGGGEGPPAPEASIGRGEDAGRVESKTEIVAVGDAGSIAGTSATTNEEPAEAEAKDRDLPKPIYKAKGKQCRKDFSVGDKVKAFKLTSADGDKTIAPANYRGRVMLLNFWGTWCKPCLEELPEFDRLYRRYRNNGLTLVAVATDEDPEAVQDFVDKHKLIAKVALGGEKAAGEYNRPNFPFSFVVDGSGEIVAAFDFVDEGCLGELEQIIRDELEQL